MVDFDVMRMNEIKAEKMEECIRKPYLIGDLIDDIEHLKKELSRKEYQIQELQKDLQILSNRIKENK